MADFPLGTEGGTKIVPLAAFAHEPADAASACIAVVDSSGDPAATIPGYRQLGAPILFVVHGQELQWWSQSAERPRHLRTLAPDETSRFFAEHREELAPERIYRAKTRGRFEDGYQLHFVDVGLMPLVEEEMGQRLSELVEHAVVGARRHLARKMTSQLGSWLFRSVFWLLAAKILRDKRVPGFENIELAEIELVFSRVSEHYGAQNREFALRAKNRHRALDSAAEVLGSFASLAHVTPESLAAVYENTLVSNETRTALGTHSTPAFLSRYVVGRLAPWIAEMAPEKRNVFEPTCGHGSFLVAAMRLLRDGLPEDMDPTHRRAYLRQRLHGVDIDPFAIELARLSLTLADIPNPDGWDLRCADVFADPQLSETAGRTTIFLANPPFENFKDWEKERLASRGVEVRSGYKATEICRRVLPRLPPGSVFGIVLPQGFINGKSATDVRSLLVKDFELAEVALLPDKIFTYSGAESALLFGRRRQAGDAQGSVRYVRVREPEVERFRSSHAVSAKRLLAQTRFATAPDHSFLVPELEEIWEECRNLPRLEGIAEVGKGLEYKSGLPPESITISKSPFQGGHPGYAIFGYKLGIHEQPQEVWMNLEPDVIRRRGTGSETEVPQVLVNYGRVSRGPWRLKALVDCQGHAVTSNFLTLRPCGAEIPLLYLWALLNSSLANAHCFAHSTKRHVLKRILRSLPVPEVSTSDMDRVSQMAAAYLDQVSGKSDKILTSQSDQHRSRDLLLAVDAQILHLYDLSPKLERQILDLFAGFKRPGVPFDFDRYLPEIVPGELRVAPSVIAQFWKAFEHRVSKGAEIFVFAEPVAPNELRDALHRPLVPAPDIGSAHFFFVDQVPEANWAHECAYAFVERDGRTAWCDASWPPDEAWDLELVARL